MSDTPVRLSIAGMHCAGCVAVEDALRRVPGVHEAVEFARYRQLLRQGVVDAIQISRATVRNIRQNLFGAFIYNSLGIPVAAGLLYPLIGWLLNPMLAGAAMALSSVTVVSNANRLRRFRVDGAAS